MEQQRGVSKLRSFPHCFYTFLNNIIFFHLYLIIVEENFYHINSSAVAVYNACWTPDFKG